MKAFRQLVCEEGFHVKVTLWKAIASWFSTQALENSRCKDVWTRYDMQQSCHVVEHLSFCSQASHIVSAPNNMFLLSGGCLSEAAAVADPAGS